MIVIGYNNISKEACFLGSITSVKREMQSIAGVDIRSLIHCDTRKGWKVSFFVYA